MTVPSPWVALILAAGVYRIWRLLADDEILDRPRRWLVRLPAKWEEGDPIPASYRIGLANFISCPFCFGWWLALATWGVWEANPHWTTIVIFPFALSAAVALIRTNLDAPE